MGVYREYDRWPGTFHRPIRDNEFSREVDPIDSDIDSDKDLPEESKEDTTPGINPPK
jgi:hypothetical protein